jgi:MFS superfamily sulfate permease-like transporter
MNNIQSRLGEITIVLVAIMWMLAIDEHARISLAIAASMLLFIEEYAKTTNKKKETTQKQESDKSCK